MLKRHVLSVLYMVRTQLKPNRGDKNIFKTARFERGKYATSAITSKFNMDGMYWRPFCVQKNVFTTVGFKNGKIMVKMHVLTKFYMRGMH